MISSLALAQTHSGSADTATDAGTQSDGTEQNSALSGERRDFRPTEEVSADQEVDFPADI
tara:strand:- start:5304 stop:5483 length:180 start_codon:yes stop_codon:yes gene_type:complete